VTEEERVTLMKYFTDLLNERDRRMTERWNAQQDALIKATDQLEERLDLLNELRGNVLTRTEYDAKHESLSIEIARNREAIDRLRGDALMVKDHRQYEERVRVLEVWRANLAGRAVALGLMGAVLIATISAVITHVIST
jgi:hypothetical protein